MIEKYVLCWKIILINRIVQNLGSRCEASFARTLGVPYLHPQIKANPPGSQTPTPHAEASLGSPAGTRCAPGAARTPCTALGMELCYTGPKTEKGNKKSSLPTNQTLKLLLDLFLHLNSAKNINDLG